MLNLKDFQFKKTNVNVEVIKKYHSEEQFMTLAVELFKEVAKITAMLASMYRLDDCGNPRKWKRNEAVLGGLMVRISKLQSSFIDQICQKRMETGRIILRPLGESLINLRYLLLNSTGDLFDKFIKYSLREEKRLLMEIEKNSEDRGYELPIEVRMRESIERAFETSEIHPDQIDESDKSPWCGKSMRKLSLSMDMENVYYAIYGFSHDIHGNWQNLITNHLEYKDGEFSPNTSWSYPRPQYLLPIGVLCCRANILYLEKCLPDCPDRKELIKLLNDCELRARVADELHEQFLQKK